MYFPSVTDQSPGSALFRKIAAILFGLGWAAFAYVLLPESVIETPDDPVTGGEVLRVACSVLSLIAGGVMSVITWRAS
jgi:hypothetical protein